MKKKFEISKAVIKKEGKYLLLKRSSHSASFPDTWDFTGGKNDPGETHEQSAIREVKEETSFDIIPGKEVKTIKYEDNEHELTFHYFIPLSFTGILRLSDDHSEYAWLTEEEIKKLPLHPSVNKFF